VCWDSDPFIEDFSKNLGIILGEVGLGRKKKGAREGWGTH